MNSNTYRKKTMKSKLLILSLFIFNISFGQNFIQLIGLETDNSEFSKGSYAVMYDSKSEKREHKVYCPIQTIGVYRNGDVLEIMSLNFLLVPTKQGFLYGTLEVKETPFDSSTDYSFDVPKGMYTLSRSITKPKFFRSKESVLELIQHQKPTFKDAIDIDFEKISFINSKFYLAKGFESRVNGSASWFNAHEKIGIHPLDFQENLSNKITHYLDNTTKNEIVLHTVSTSEVCVTDEENIDSTYVLPWSNSINKHDEVYFDIDFNINGVQIIPLTALQGNSSRSFLARGKAIEEQKMYSDLKLKKYKKERKSPAVTDALSTFTSPDKSTKIELFKNQLTVTDLKSNRILKRVSLNYTKIIMSEFATGSYSKKWKTQFE